MRNTLEDRMRKRLSTDVRPSRTALPASTDAPGAYRHFFRDNAAGGFRASGVGRLLEVNPAMVQLLGTGSREELVGQPLRRYFVESVRWERLLDQIRAAGSVTPDEVRLRRKDGSVFVALVGASLTGGRISGRAEMCGTVVDITRHKRREAALRRKAYRDPLTGLVNRRFLEEHAERCLAVARRRRRRVGVLYADLTGFKRINDTYGHAAGDAALAETGRKLLEESRAGDVAARVGGDEFVVLLTDVDDLRSAVAVARRLAAELSVPVSTEEATFRVGADIGVALHPEHGRSFEELVEAADDAMYRAKANATNVEMARPVAG